MDGLGTNEMWREPEDGVAWRRRDSRAAFKFQEDIISRIFQHFYIVFFSSNNWKRYIIPRIEHYKILHFRLNL